MSVDERERTARRSPEEGADDSWWSVLRPLVLRVHFYGGILIAPFLLVVACTGLLYVFSPQLEEVVYEHALHVPAPPAATQPSPVQPLSSQVDAARAARPGDELSSVRPAATPTDTTQVLFAAPDQPDSSYARTVFVDPHNADVRDVLVTYGGSQALPLRTWIDQLHRNLNLGDPGRIYSELAASWLWVMVLGGLTLWIGRSRSLRDAVAPRTRPKGKSRLLSWHGSVGLWAAAGLLFLSATGLTWSTYAGGSVGDLRSALSWDDPSVSTTLPAHAAGGDVGIDRVLDEAHGKSVTGRVEITPPSKPGEAYSVQQLEKHWPTQQDSVAVDPSTGQVTDVLRFADYPVMAKLARWGIDAHMGVLFGLPNQLLLGALALGLICVLFWGYRMWWSRGPSGAFGRLPERGAWRRIPTKVLAPLIVLAVFLGYFLPLFGASLVLFAAVDLWFGRRGRRAAARAREAGMR